MKEVYKPVEKPVMDWVGFTLFTSSIASILLSLTLLTYGSENVSFGEALLAVGILLLLGFIAVELRVLNPLLDLRLFKIWQFTGGIVAQILYSIAFGASITLTSIYLQAVRGFSASATGLALLPFELAFLIAGVTGGRLSDIYGYVPLTIAGLLSAGVSLYALSELTPSLNPDINLFLIATALLGIGGGLFTSPNTSSIMTSVPPHRRGVASSIRTISFNVGFMVSLNVAILAVTTYVPYDIASKILTLGDIPEASLQEMINEFAHGISTSFRTQALIMFAAIPFSLTRILKKGGGVKR